MIRTVDMRHYRVFVLWAIPLILLSVAILGVVQWLRVSRASPITLRYLKPDRSNNGGRTSYVFWVTNHTAANLAIVLSTIQVRTGSTWSNCFSMHESLRFLSTATPIPTPDLAPHSTGTSTVDLPFPPPASPWRVKALVTEKLGGLEKVSAGIINHRRLMEIRRATDDNGISRNPFKGTFSTYGHAREVVSEEVAK
jgi:hypothetical protein